MKVLCEACEELIAPNLERDTASCRGGWRWHWPSLSSWFGLQVLRSFELKGAGSPYWLIQYSEVWGGGGGLAIFGAGLSFDLLFAPFAQIPCSSTCSRAPIVCPLRRVE